MKTSKKAYKFNPFQKAWISDMINQKYKQAKGTLTLLNPDGTIDSCCCLGIACELAPKFGYKLEREKGKGVKNHNLSYNGEEQILPEGIVEALKLRSNNGKTREGNCLTSMNDCRMTHKEIGEYILANPENVFTE